MTYPGPWEQGADYERSTDYMARSVYGWYGDDTYDYVGGGPPFDDEMNAALDQASAVGGAAVADTPSGSLGVQSFASTDTVVPFSSGRITVRRSETGGEWDTANLLDVGYYYNTYLRPSAPPTSTGVEFEANASTPTGASLHLVLLGDAADSSIPAGVNATPDASILVRIYGGSTYANANVLLTQITAGGGTVADLTLDMTRHMGAQGEIAVSIDVSKFDLWSYYDPNRGGDTILASVRTGNGTKATYLLHPPRHRWLYDTPPPTPGLPPLRQHPRSDGLGASTARRHYPRPRSAQASNRRRGGFD